jgi:hypothetical protein
MKNKGQKPVKRKIETREMGTKKHPLGYFFQGMFRGYKVIGSTALPRK